MLALALASIPPVAMAAIEVAEYNGGGPATVSSFSNGDTISGVSTIKTGQINFPANGSITQLAGGTLNFHPPYNSFDRVWRVPVGFSSVFVNQGTINYSHDAARAGIDFEGGDYDFQLRNEGTFNSTVVICPGKSIYSLVPGDKGIVNTGTFRHSGSGIFGWEVSNAAYFHNDGGTLESTGGGQLRIQGTGALRNRSTTGSVFNTTGGGAIVLFDNWTECQGVATGSPVIAATSFGTVNTGVVNVTGQGMVWTDLDPNNGLMINNGLLLTTQDGGQIDILTGVFRNNGTNSQGGSARCFLQFAGLTTYENYGLHEYTHASSGNRMGTEGGDGYFDNRAGGTYRTASGSGNVTWEELSDGGNDGILRNRGAVEAAGGFINLFNWALDMETLDIGGVLNEGFFICSGADITINHIQTNHATLRVSAPLINTIGPGAGITLTPGNDLNKLTPASLNAVYGEFGLLEGRAWTTGGALTTGVSTAFTFGISTGIVSKLTVSESSTIQGFIHVVDEGLLPGLYTVVDFSSGDLTDGGILEGLFTTDQDLFMDVIVSELDDTVVIEIHDRPTGTELLFE